MEVDLTTISAPELLLHLPAKHRASLSFCWGMIKNKRAAAIASSESPSTNQRSRITRKERIMELLQTIKNENFLPPYLSHMMTYAKAPRFFSSFPWILTPLPLLFSP